MRRKEESDSLKEREQQLYFQKLECEQTKDTNSGQHFDFQADAFGRQRRFFTRKQWHMMGRVVNVFDHEAAKIFQTRNTGRAMHCFSIEQTRAA